MGGKRRKGTGATPSPLTSQNSLKAEEIIFSNVDLLTKILLRLPAKSVLRFKSVTNQWRTIVSDPKFQTTHAKLNPTPVVSGQYVLSPTNQCFWTVRDLLPVPFESNISSLDVFSCYEQMKSCSSTQRFSYVATGDGVE